MARNLTVTMVDDDAAWDRFVVSSPQGTVFAGSAWLRASAEAQGAQPLIVAVTKKGKIVAGTPVLVIRRGPFTKVTSPALTPYSGFLYRPDPGKRPSEAGSFNNDCAELLMERLAGMGQHVFMVHSPGFNDLRPFIWRGWERDIRYTYRIDITDPETVWDLMERRVRTVLRNAEENLLIDGAVDTGEFVTLYERIYGDRGRKLPFHPRMVAAQVDRIRREPFADFRSVRDEAGRVLSTMILVRDERCVYAWLSGSIPGENSSGAFSLLFWDAVRRYSGEYGELDMVGANIPSIAFFKKGFGGTLTPYYYTGRYSSPFTRLAFAAYSRLNGLTR